MRPFFAQHFDSGASDDLVIGALECAAVTIEVGRMGSFFAQDRDLDTDDLLIEAFERAAVAVEVDGLAAVITLHVDRGADHVVDALEEATITIEIDWLRTILTLDVDRRARSGCTFERAAVTIEIDGDGPFFAKNGDHRAHDGLAHDVARPLDAVRVVVGRTVDDDLCAVGLLRALKRAAVAVAVDGERTIGALDGDGRACDWLARESACAIERNGDFSVGTFERNGCAIGDWTLEFASVAVGVDGRCSIRALDGDLDAGAATPVTG